VGTTILIFGNRPPYIGTKHEPDILTLPTSTFTLR